MRRTVGIAAGIIGAAAIAVFAVSCGDSTGPNAKTYIANLNAAAEGAGHTSPGSGVATFVDLGSEIDWSLTLTNMTAVIASHIHGPAPAGTNAPIIFNLFIPIVATGTVTGEVMHGTLTNASNANVSLDSLRVLLNNGKAYVNVHTTANPGGEIRDQIHPEQ
jgi:hypothetical protein